jgi:hypothetical protein
MLYIYMKKIPSTVFILAVFALVGFLVVYTRGKNMSMNSELEPTEMTTSNVPVASSSEARFASANGIQTTMPKNIPSQPAMPDPAALLPHDTNSQWASLTPSGDGALQNVNLLQAGSIIGINTVGSSLRNANLQLRCDPIIEKKNTGPWMNSTIDAPLPRKSLDGGDCGL